MKCNFKNTVNFTEKEKYKFQLAVYDLYSRAKKAKVSPPKSCVNVAELFCNFVSNRKQISLTGWSGGGMETSVEGGSIFHFEQVQSLRSRVKAERI
jgi:hypothetical protein